MGLSITYSFEFRGSKRDLRKKLEWLKDRFEKLPVKSVGELVEIECASIQWGYGRCKGASFFEHHLGLMMALSYFDPTVPEKNLGEIIWRMKGTANVGSLAPHERRRYDALSRRVSEIQKKRQEKIRRSGNGFLLRVDVGEGCEYLEVMLGRFGNGRLWKGTRYTKTQYAERFVACHTAVIEMLGLCHEAGILREVKDAGQYWETRDLEVLGRNINASTESIRAIVAAFKGPAEKKGYVVCAPIDESANYVRTGKRRKS